MRKPKRRTDRRLQRILGIVCLSFLCGTAGGALLANLLPTEQRGALAVFLEQTLSGTDTSAYGSIFLKYLKYDLIIWLGGWMQLGLLFSGAAFLFRSVCVGFTSAMMMTVYGAKGIFLSAISFLPQNLFLIPAYLLMMSASLYYALSCQEAGEKRALKREKKRKQTEYCILFGISVLLLATAAGIERMLLFL